MKPNIQLISLAIVSTYLTGCAARHATYERGWIGGTFAGVETQQKVIVKSNVSPGISGFPAQLQPEYSGGLLIEEIHPETPISKAGLQEGDLILKLDEQPLTRVKALRNQIDKSQPRSVRTFTIYRDGSIKERTVTIGKESYQKERYLRFGIGLSTRFEVDLLPDPDFSLVVAGLKRNHERIELQDTAIQFQKRMQSDNQTTAEEKPKGIKSGEGWKTWLTLLSLGGHKRILSQETLEPAATAQIAAQ